MNIPGLTRAQRDCLLLIQELTEADGVPPTVREIAHELCVSSPGNVAGLLRCLEQRGAISRRPGSARSIEVLRRVPAQEECDLELTPRAIEALQSATTAAGGN